MKKYIFIIVSVFLSLSVYAETIDLQQAKRIAQETIKAQNTNLTIAYTSSSTNGTAEFYVFNKAENRGFVIVSAEDMTDTYILGYSDEGSFDYDKLPENAKWWLSQYSEQIRKLRLDNPTGKLNRVISKTATPKYASSVEPLIKSKWSQSSPYNNLCPMDAGGRAVTGCVATAMAQIMYYHKWPVHGHGVHSYSWNGTSHRVDYSASYYDWGNMTDTYNNSSTQAAKDAVAKLMYDCGVSVNMMYSSSSSGTYSDLVPNAMKTYFMYDDGLRYVSRGRGITDDEWDKLLKQELDNKRPVYYSGAHGNSGHAFVCDGYDASGNFHFNFGWGGSGDAYYTSKAAGGYSEGQDIVVGISRGASVKINGLYYNILGSGKAEITYPDDPKNNYSGDISIPSTVVYDQTTYNVTGISGAAFSGCKQLTSVTIPSSVQSIGTDAFTVCPALKALNLPWTTPIACGSSAFDSETYSNAALNVPEGTAEAYSAMLPWSIFSLIQDNKGTKIEWNVWNAFEKGTASYSYDEKSPLDSLKGRTIMGYPIKKRLSKSMANRVQVWVANWGQNVDFIIELDELTNKCKVPMQSVGKSDVDFGDLFISDLPSYKTEYTYDDYPCSYNPATGVFDLNVTYYYKGTESYGIMKDKLTVDMSTEDKWTLAGTGTYNYTSIYEAESKNLNIYRNESRPSIWKIEMKHPEGEKVDFVFVVSPQDNVITFSDQYCGLQADEKINVGNLADFQPAAEASYYEPSTQTFHFNTYYHAGEDYYGSGFETFTLVTSGIADVRSDLQNVNVDMFNAQGIRVNSDYRGVIIYKGKAYIRR